MLGSQYTGRYPEKVRGLVMAEPGFIEYKQMQALQSQPGRSTVRTMFGLVKVWLTKWFATGDRYARADYFAQQAILSFQAQVNYVMEKCPNWKCIVLVIPISRRQF